MLVGLREVSLGDLVAEPLDAEADVGGCDFPRVAPHNSSVLLEPS